MCVYLYVCKYMCVGVYISVGMCMGVYVCGCVCVCTFMCACVRMCSPVHTTECAYIHTHTAAKKGTTTNHNGMSKDQRKERPAHSV